MNEKSQPKTQAIKTWVRDAAEQLASAGITSALLDAEIILAHTLRRSRTYLHAHGEDDISPRELDIANARLDLRLDRTPVAYIIGHKEFYGRQFKVTPSTLIPRPESEVLITLLGTYIAPDAARLVDVGTGTGCLGITAKLEFPQLTVTLTDVSRHALKVATANAEAHRAEVVIQQSDLLESVAGMIDYCIANLPYVDQSWERSPETNHEPKLALFADDEGLALIYRLINQATTKITPGGLLLLEADPCQHDRITTYASTHGFTPIETTDYIVMLRKT